MKGDPLPVPTMSFPDAALARISFRFGCVALGLVLAACGKSVDKDAPKAGAAPPAMPVTVQRAAKQRVPISLEAVGQAEGSREVEVRSRVSGIIERRAYQEGAPAKAGDLLFAIERAPYELAAAQARAALQQERVRQEQARRESARLKPLVDEKAISRREFDEATSTFEQSTAAIAGAQARLSEAELNLSYTKVTAPISGVTGRALRSEGSLVTANTESSLLTTMTQLDPVWIRFSLAESDYDSIRGAERQARVKIMKQDGSSAAENGRLNFTGQTVDPKLGTVQLRAEFANPGLKWLPGQFVKVQILAGTQEAYLVPQVAVMQTAQGRLVWIVGADGKAAMRSIGTAGSIGSNWLVTSGLQEGDLVIVDNLMKVRPGAPVQPVPQGEPGQKAPAEPGTSPGKNASGQPVAPAGR